MPYTKIQKAPSEPPLPPTYVEGFSDKDLVRRMPYSQLHCGLLVSALGFGGGGLGGKNFYGEYDEQEAIDTVIKAVQSGVNYIDTAPYYGHGFSETILGKALKQIPRQSYYISTKIGRYHHQFDFDYKVPRIKASLEESRQRLGLDVIDVIIIHDIEFALVNKQWNVIKNETLPYLIQLKRTHQIKHIGISALPLSVLKQMVEELKHKYPGQHVIDFVLTYSKYTLLDNSLRNYGQYFQENKIDLINASPISLGLLSNQGPPDWHPAKCDIKFKCTEAASDCKKNNVELGKLALYFSMNQTFAKVTLCGMNNLKVLRANLDVTMNGLTEHEKRVFKAVREKYFDQDLDLHWEGEEPEKYKLYLQDKVQ